MTVVVSIAAQGDRFRIRGVKTVSEIKYRNSKGPGETPLSKKTRKNRKRKSILQNGGFLEKTATAFL
jgi:hypothetical protein